MNRKELLLKILKAFNDNVKPNQSDFELETELFGKLIETLQDDTLISGANVVRGGQGSKVLAVFTDNAKITIKGIEYLEANK